MRAKFFILALCSAVLCLMCMNIQAQGMQDFSQLRELPANMHNIIQQGRASSALDIDNDSLLFRNADGLYTSGLRFSRSYRIKVSEGWQSAGWRFGQQLYTPVHVTIPVADLGPLDRPYAGWIYGGMFYRIEHPDGSELDFGLDLGCLGPCALGRQTQEVVHSILHQPKPLGWSSQISTEPGLVLHLGGRATPIRLGSALDVQPGVSGRLGNIFTDLTAEATFRAGQLHLGAEQRVYGFLRLALRAVAYDATLQGGLFGDETQRTVRPKRDTGEIEAGVQWQGREWALRASVVSRSNQIDGQTASLGQQGFLRLSIIYAP